MGLNVNLVMMLGIPDETQCPKCSTIFNNSFDDYDIEGGVPNPRPGVWILNQYCPHCEHEFITNYIVLPTFINQK